ncbi:NADPH-dependent 2,4-dienoyl-CoA reductase/sulfur reductase-like enzyme [Rhodoglobus vestalii]|uniref:NADPH-dependent 2,4-dienoyl-CoA reductase/sulfur reductase-like enzyme n=1 Tax=Rhodoglobus vestalii TaxID=193384 RepID=A0A8H2PV06_9MICO|nr:FAD-dependent oxidoreductase [Rhodoglobus vestalii]TQO20317.1 NADPH-dependent 2,4-dienoyl-CoA reductase/sulfur reductase-like enzyme [Rhodoglobus vestalii]
MSTANATPARRRILVIGGVAAGMSFATRMRRRDEHAEIIIFERSGHVSFANCGLAYYLGGVITERDDLLLQTPASLGSRFGLDVRVNHNVTAIHPDEHTITVHNHLDNTTTIEPYDELVIATGASAIIPPMPGSERMLQLRNIEDVDALDAALGALDPSTANTVVLGAGYIGIEMAENLIARGLSVTLVQLDPNILRTFDVEMITPIEAHLRAHGVDLRIGTAAIAVHDTTVELSDGSAVAADVVIAAVGVRPENALAVNAGLTVGAGGGIRVNAGYETSSPHIYAVGDVAEKIGAISGEPGLVALAGPANRDGRYLADTIAGDAVHSPPALGTAIVGVFDLTAASLGSTELALRAAGRNIRVIHTHPVSHAGYFPGAESLSIKLIVDADTDLILGAQAVGRDGVDKRMDVLATATSAGLTASALADLELAYAPQYGSAKDPINHLGYVARNLRDGLSASVQWHETDAELAAGSVLVDVRTAAEFERGGIPHAINIPLDDLRGRLNELGDRRVIAHCQVGQRGHTAVRILSQNGFDAANLDGGYRTWMAAMG